MEVNAYIRKCQDYDEERVKDIIYGLLDKMNARDLLKKGSNVLIKPNLVMACDPSLAVTTHPSLVCAAAEYFVSLGAKVVIAESPGGPYNRLRLQRLYAQTGMQKAAEKSGAELNFDCRYEKLSASHGKVKKEFDVIKPVLDADVIINIAKLKTHKFAHYTGAVKNIYGVVPGITKTVYHAAFQDRRAFCDMIIDLCDSVSPDISIIDGVVAMEGNGPTAGNARHMGVIIASKDPNIADKAAAKLAGIPEENIPTLKNAFERGRAMRGAEGILTDADAEVEETILKLTTKDNLAFASLFPSALQPFMRRLCVRPPEMDPRVCVGCGACMTVCPGKAISIKNNKAAVNRRKCIRCFCCHELCPEKAVRI